MRTCGLSKIPSVSVLLYPHYTLYIILHVECGMKNERIAVAYRGIPFPICHLLNSE